MADTRFLLVSVATKREAVRPERFTVPVRVIAPEEESPVNPESAPAEERTAVGVLMKLVNPVADAKFIPLITLELVFVAALKFTPFTVFVLLAFAPFERVRLSPFTVTAPAPALLLVTDKVWAEPATVLA